MISTMCLRLGLRVVFLVVLVMPELEGEASVGTYHVPVMVAEVLDSLAGANRVLDGTLGGGGHSAALLEAGATVTGIDRDPRALREARHRLAEHETAGRFRAVLANYAEAADALRGERFDGILLDLGVSSHQIDDASRGFTFRE